MKKYLIFCLTFILISCAAPATEVIPTQEIVIPSETSSPIPNTPEPESFLKVFGDEPIVPKGSYGTWDDRYTDPGAVVYHDGIFHMFRNGFRGFPAASQVGYVTSPDGYTWTKQGDDPVFETKDVPYAKTAMYASSAIVEDDGTWVLYFYTWESGSVPSSVIGRAIATDPHGPWIPDAEPILIQGSAGAWDAKQVLAPHVLKTDDGYVMYYSGTDSASKQKIGIATSTDGIQWAKYNDTSTTEAPYLESDPIFFPGEAGSWDANWVHQPSVLETTQGWVMFYRGTKDTSGNTMALGFATSDDGIHWNRSSLNPIFIPSDIKGAAYFWFQNALYVDDTYFIFIEGDISQTTQIYLATHEGEIPR